MQTLSVVIPLLNEEENLGAVHAKLVAVAEGLRERRNLELIFVDDGSTDASFAKLKDLAAQDKRIKVIRFPRNFGSHAAILAGYEAATGDHVVNLAADLQDPPEVMAQMLDKADQGIDVVWALREEREDSFATKLFSHAYSRLLRRFALPNYPHQGFDFVLVSKRVKELVLRHAEQNTSIFGEVLWLGFPQASVAFKRVARRAGRSKWTLRKKLKLAVDSFVSFSYAPIRLMSMCGIASACLGVLYAILVVALRLARGTPIQGWASLMVVVLIIGGVQMTLTGIIGEYLWRTLDVARKRPRFIVSDRVNS